MISACPEKVADFFDKNMRHFFKSAHVPKKLRDFFDKNMRRKLQGAKLA